MNIKLSEKQILKKIFEGVSPSFMKFYKEKGIIKSLEEKVHLFLTNNKKSEEDIKVFFEAVKSTFEAVLSEKDIRDFFKESKKLEKSLGYFEDKIDQNLLQKLKVNIDKLKDFIKSQEKVLKNLENISKNLLKDI